MTNASLRLTVCFAVVPLDPLRDSTAVVTSTWGTVGFVAVIVRLAETSWRAVAVAGRNRRKRHVPTVVGW